MRPRLIVGGTLLAGALMALSVTAWVAFPSHEDLELPQPLKAYDARSFGEDPDYSKDFASLAQGFRPQSYRSFCGPATLATVLRAYGVAGSDQTSIFPAFGSRLKAFYNGMNLAELNALAQSAGLNTELVYADSLSLDEFRERLKSNLSQAGDFVIVNYDRRVLEQEGAGHISPVAAYDAAEDSFLVLDEAAYRYPFTWVPAALLYSAVRTQDGDRFRGVLFVRGYYRVR
jgi:hypothetical protein